MTVELIPNCEHCHQMGVANGTFFTMVNESGIANVLGKQTTNDPINASNEDARECAKILKDWSPPKDWTNGIKNKKMKDLFIEFFNRCDGFTTY